MSSLLSTLVAALLLVNLVALGTSRIGTVVRAVATQGVLLGLLAVAAHGSVSLRVLALAVASISLKGWLIPVILFRALRQVEIKREVEPSLGLLPSLLLVEAMPFLVEIGVLLDLFVGIFVLSIIIHHINREFASLDTRRMSLLKD